VWVLSLNHSRPSLEIAFTFTLIIIVLWMPRPLQDWFSVVVLAWIIGSTLLTPAHARWIGFGADGLGRSWWVIPSAVALSAVQILIAHHERTLHGHMLAGIVPRVAGYAIWSLLQQFILQNYFLARLLQIFRPRWAITLGAILFALAHLPNPVLTFATLIWGFIASALFLRYRDLYSVGFAHALLGLTLAICIPASVHHNMRVGLGFLRYHPKEQNQRSQIPHNVSTEACVIVEAATCRSALQARP